jgi:hypothetical protein
VNAITFAVSGTTYTMPISADFHRVLAAVGNLLRDQVRHGVESVNFRNQAVTLCQQAEPLIAAMSNTQEVEAEEGERIAFTLLGNTPAADWQFTAVVGYGLRNLLTAIATLVATRSKAGDTSSYFVEDAISVCIGAASALQPGH